MIRPLLLLSDKLRDRLRRRRETVTFASGRRGEDLAHRFLQKKGYVVIARNFRTRTGSAEVDLIARSGDAVVFIEVKSRQSDEFGSPDRAIDQAKELRILRAASEYLRRAGLPEEAARFDIVNIVFHRKPAIEHIEDAFYFPRAV